MNFRKLEWTDKGIKREGATPIILLSASVVTLQRRYLVTNFPYHGAEPDGNIYAYEQEDSANPKCFNSLEDAKKWCQQDFEAVVRKAFFEPDLLSEEQRQVIYKGIKWGHTDEHRYGGQQCGTPKGVTLSHPDFGVKIEVREFRSVFQNREAAGKLFDVFLSHLQHH